jgi:hypothetical protein
MARFQQANRIWSSAKIYCKDKLTLYYIRAYKTATIEWKQLPLMRILISDLGCLFSYNRANADALNNFVIGSR